MAETNGKRPDGRYLMDDGQILLAAGGEEYILPMLEKADLKEAEAYYRDQIQSPVQALNEFTAQLHEVSPEIRDGMMRIAFDRMQAKGKVRTVSHQQVKEWLDSRDGLGYCLYLQLRKRYKDMTVEKALDIIDSVSIAEALKARDRAASEELRRAAQAAGV
jgi:hypothetical protein